MGIDEKKSLKYLEILKEELVPAYGCTEPIAVAYTAALARDYLKDFPDKITALCSGNIIKNVKGVIVPGTNDLRGVETSVLMGLVCGDAKRKLELLTGADESDLIRVRELLEQHICEVGILKTTASLHIIVRMEKGEHYSEVTLMHAHTNLAKVVVDGEVLVDNHCSEDVLNDSFTDRKILNVRDIILYADSADLESVKELLDRQITFNMAIAEEGLRGKYGTGVGDMIMKSSPGNAMAKAKAYAAAGSDARMSGCEMPVITNSGSGNQGITASLPVVIYAREHQKTQEQLYRALLVSNLIAIHLKTGIGRLSAYCGAVSAACGAGVGMTYLAGGDMDAIEKTITNTVGNVSGIVCDGAKSSCAAKIAASVDAAILAHNLALSNRAFEPDTGIIQDNIEGTIESVGRVASEGMQQTDHKILSIMIEK